MPAGLKKAWGLSDAKKGPSDAQANAFRASFQAAIAPITAALGWTATNAEKAKHDPQSSARDKAYELYQSVLSRIDPSDESKAASAIADALSNVSGLGSVVDGVKKVVETAMKAWEAVADVLTEVVQKIGELEEWGMDGVGDLLSLVKKIQDAVANRAWEVAKETLEQLKEKLQPLYEEYEKQKEAKEKYDKERPSLEEGFKAISKAVGELPGKVGELIGEITKGLDGAGKKADDKDFVGAFGGIGGLGGLFDTLKKLADDMAKAKADYEKRLGDIQPKFKDVDEGVENEGLKLAQGSIQSRRTTMKTAESEKNYATALTEANAIQTEIASYETQKKQVDKQKTDFDAKEKKLKPDVDAARKHEMNPTPEVTNADLTTKRTSIVGKAEAMEGHKNKQNWGQGIAEADALAVEVAAYNTALKDHKAEKVDYDTRHGKMVPRWKKVALPVKSKLLQEAQTGFVGSRAKIEGCAGKGNYDEALKLLDVEEANITQTEGLLDEMRAKLKRCGDRLKKLKKPLSESTTTGAPYAMGDLQKRIIAKQGEARQAIGDEDANKATVALDWLEPAVTSYVEALKAMKNAKVEYEKREPDVEKRKKVALGYPKPIKDKGTLDLKTRVDKNHHAKGYAIGKYSDALGLLFSLKVDLTALQTAIDKLEKMEDEYNTGLGLIQTDLDDACTTTTKNTELLSWKKIITDTRPGMETSAAAGDFEHALFALGFVEKTLKSFKVCKDDIKAEKAEYDSRLKKLDKKLTATSADVPGEEIKEAQGKIKKLLGEAAAVAAPDKEDYDAALLKLDAVEVEIAKCLALIKAQNQRIADYRKREPGVTQSVKNMEACDHPDAKKKRSEIVGLQSSMDTSRDAGAYAAALTTMNMLQAQLSAYAAIVARVKSDGAGGGGTTPSSGGTKKKKKKKKPATGGSGDRGDASGPTSGGGDGGGGQNEAQESQSTTTSDTSDSNPIEQQSQNPFG